MVISNPCLSVYEMFYCNFVKKTKQKTLYLVPSDSEWKNLCLEFFFFLHITIWDILTPSRNMNIFNRPGVAGAVL